MVREPEALGTGLSPDHDRAELLELIEVQKKKEGNMALPKDWTSDAYLLSKERRKRTTKAHRWPENPTDSISQADRIDD